MTLHPIVSSRGVGLDTTERTSVRWEVIYLDIPQCRWTPDNEGYARRQPNLSTSIPWPSGGGSALWHFTIGVMRLATGHIRAAEVRSAHVGLDG